MDYKEYKTKRKKLLDEANKLHNECNWSNKEEASKTYENINKKITEIKSLDEIYKNDPINLANQKALENNSKISPKAMGILQNNNYINFKGEVESVMKEKTSEYREQFFNQLQGKFTNSSLTTTTGSSVIPTTTWDNILEGMGKSQGIVADIRILNIPGNFSIPIEDITNPAEWKEELAESNDHTGTYKSIQLKGYELMKLISMSESTLSMSINQFESYLTTELTNSITGALNNAIWNGTGGTDNQPKGILTEKFTTNENLIEYTALNLSDIMKAIGMIPSNYRSNAKIYLNSNMYFKLLSLESSSGQPIVSVSLKDNPVSKFLGQYDIRVDDYLADDVIMIGDPQKYFMNFSKPTEIMMDRSSGFTSATVKYRALAICDGALATNRAFVKLSKKVTQ